MGKGADGCDSNAGMSMINPELDAQAQQELIQQQKSLRAQEIFEQKQAHMAEEKTRAGEIEKEEISFAEQTLEKAAQARLDGATEKELDKIFDKRAREQTRRRAERFQTCEFPKLDAPSSDDPDLKYMEGLDPIERASYLETAIDETPGPNCPRELRFQVEFLNSPDFRANLRKVLSDRTVNEQTGRAVTGKDMENAYRHAMRMTLGITNASQTIALWTSPSGTEYEIEVLQEHSGRAVFDIVMMARPVGAKNPEVYTLQWKSYQTHDEKGHEPEKGYFKDRESAKIDKLTSLSGMEKKSLDAAVKKVQTRFLATNTYSDTSSLNQTTLEGTTQWVTYDTKMTRPEVHKSLTRVDPDKMKDSFCALPGKIEKKRGKYVAPLQAQVPVYPKRGNPYFVTVITTIIAEVNPDTGKPILDDKGQPKILSGGTGKLSIDIPQQGWYSLQRASCPGRLWSEAAAEAGLHD